jgi:hypothetical protein
MQDTEETKSNDPITRTMAKGQIEWLIDNRWPSYAGRQPEDILCTFPYRTSDKDDLLQYIIHKQNASVNKSPNVQDIQFKSIQDNKPIQDIKTKSIQDNANDANKPIQDIKNKSIQDNANDANKPIQDIVTIKATIEDMARQKKTPNEIFQQIHYHMGDRHEVMTHMAKTFQLSGPFANREALKKEIHDKIEQDWEPNTILMFLPALDRDCMESYVFDTHRMYKEKRELETAFQHSLQLDHSVKHTLAEFQTILFREREHKQQLEIWQACIVDLLETFPHLKTEEEVYTELGWNEEDKIKWIPHLKLFIQQLIK